MDIDDDMDRLALKANKLVREHDRALADLARLQAENGRLREALTAIAEDVRCPACDSETVARQALTEPEKGMK